MDESLNRELGQFQQQLENTSENFVQLRNDLTRLFDKIEADSKNTIQEAAKLEGVLNSHLQSDKVQKEDLERRLEDLKNSTDDNSKEINREKINRINFETEMKTGIKIAKILGAIAIGVAIASGAIASIITAFVR